MKPRTWCGIAALALASCPIGCDEPGLPSDGRTVADSAGVEIVTVRMAGEGAQGLQRVHPDPDVEIGTVAGLPEYELSSVLGAVSLPGGGVAVANRGTNEVRYYDAEGMFVASVGRSGEGPGEFRRISFMGLAGDTLLVYDQPLARVTLIDGSREVMGTFRTPFPPFSYVSGVLQGPSSLISWEFTGSEDQNRGVYALPMEISVTTMADQQTEVVAEGRSSEEGNVEYQGRVVRAFRPFGRKGDVAVGDGVIFVLSSDDDATIRILGSDGRLIRILRVEVEPRRIQATDVEEWIESWMSHFSPASEEIEEWWRHGFGLLSPPVHLPTFRSLSVDTDGNLCAERYPLLIGSAPLYWCFSIDGRLLRGIQLPPGVFREGPHPFWDSQIELGGDYVLGVWEDELGVQYVRRLRLD